MRSMQHAVVWLAGCLVAALGAALPAMATGVMAPAATAASAGAFAELGPELTVPPDRFSQDPAPTVRQEPAGTTQEAPSTAPDPSSNPEPTPVAEDPGASEEALRLSPRARRLIQRGLAVAGFDAGASDGVFGEITRAAIRAWQTEREEAPTGYLDRQGATDLQRVGEQQERLDETQRALRDTQQERDAVEQERDAVEQERDAVEQERDAVEQERDAVEQERDAVEQERNAAQQERDAVQEERDAAQQERDTVEQERDTAQEERDALQEERDAAQEERDAAQEERDAAQEEREAAQQEREAAQQAAEAAAEAEQRAQQQAETAQEQAAADRAQYIRWIAIVAVVMSAVALIFWIVSRRSVTSATRERARAEAASEAARWDLAARDERERLASQAPAVFLDGADADGQLIALRVPGVVVAGEGGAVVGRNPFDSTVVLDHDEVSRRHFRLFARGTSVMIEDLNSTNGTTLNDVQLEPGASALIEGGAVLGVGTLRLTVSLHA